jgi:hypothetical protein
MKKFQIPNGSRFDSVRNNIAVQEWDKEKVYLRAAWWEAMVRGERPAYALEEQKRMDEVNWKTDKTAGMEQMKSRGLQFTFNGDWGQSRDDVREACSRSRNLEEKVENLKKLPYYKILVEDLVAECWRKVLLPKGFQNYSAAVELSTHSANEARVHLHLFVSSNGERQRVADAAQWIRFQGVGPSYVRPTGFIESYQRTRHTNSALDQGHHYLQVRKQGCLVQATNYRKCERYRVQGKWLEGYWQMNKLSSDDFVAEMLESRIPRYQVTLENIRAIERDSFALSEKRRIDAYRREERKRLRPQRPPVPVEVEWMAHLPLFNKNVDPYDPTRCLPMVYEGGTKVGKSTRCREWVPEGLLEVDCRNGAVKQPDLSGWLTGKYQAVLFDEGNWRLLWDFKTLFQNKGFPAHMQSSATNMHSYHLQFLKVPIFITSNDFFEGLTEDAHLEYVVQNMYYLRFHGKCSLPEPEPGQASPVEDDSWWSTDLPSHIMRRLQRLGDVPTSVAVGVSDAEDHASFGLQDPPASVSQGRLFP